MRQFAARLEAVREEERKRVAREIHDELGQALTVLKLDLHWVQNKTPRHQKEAKKRMNSMMRQIDQAIDSVRKIAYELRPAILDDLGLGPAIEWQLREFQAKTGIRTELRSNIEKLDFAGGRAAVVFRVVQEALTNVMRHAGATRVKLSMNLEKSRLHVSISDNGKGMSADGIAGTHSMGIVGMKERIASTGGEFTIQSQTGKGTGIDMYVPIEADD
jgi:signal transduction histidine kinase